MFRMFFMIFAVCGQGWAMDSGDTYGEKGSNGSHNRNLNLKLHEILNNEDGSDSDEGYPSYEDSTEEWGSRQVPRKKESLSLSSSPKVMTTSRLQQDIEDHDSSGGDDPYEDYIVNQVMPALDQQYAISHPGNLSSFISEQMQKYKGVSQRDFNQWQVSIHEFLNILELNIIDSVRNIKEYLFDNCKKDSGTFEIEVMKLVKGRRSGMDLLGTKSEAVVNCKSLIFKFYAKELFERFIQVSCDNKAYNSFMDKASGSLMDQEKDLDKSVKSKNPSFTPMVFTDLDAWKNFQSKTMISFEAFTNDLCSVKYGGINDIKVRVGEVSVPLLKKYLEINLIFLTTWYAENRTFASKALTAWGTKTSKTKTIFDDFVTEFKRRFCIAKFAELQIVISEDDVDRIVAIYDKKFGESDNGLKQTTSTTITNITSAITPSSWFGWGGTK